MKKYNLVGDIGATNARFAIVAEGGSELENIQYLPCADFNNLQGAIKSYLSGLSEINVKSACIAIAGAIHTQSFKLANNHWHINKNDVAAELDSIHLHWINDFTAQALATIDLSKEDTIVINSGCKQSDRVRLAIGPGTGLGVCGLLPSTNGWKPVMGEGGHVDFAPNSELQFEILKLLQKRFGHVSVERLLSGPGILNLYQALAEINEQKIQFESPAEVTSAALDVNPDQLSIDTLKLFCQIFGSVVGDAALNMGALGGVYITGGVIRNFLDFFLKSEFQNSFEDKGRLRDYMISIPIYFSKARYMGLLGAVKMLNKQ